MARAPLSLKARAIGLLAQREHSRIELRRKLLSIERRSRMATLDADMREDAEDAAGASEAAIDALLDTLAAEGYLDETRFVESRLHVRAGRFGAQRIQQELARHGLQLDAEQQAALRATEMERAREVWHKRFGPEPSRDVAEQARQTRFLLARGFSPDLVRRLLRA
ncbi:regulatory protein RecX [Roseateles sp.]|uniref:regulatory protein RecX n=1 Tax=Roseateles sp. TaxID=1971397 RepID=UPI0039EC30F9